MSWKRYLCGCKVSVQKKEKICIVDEQRIAIFVGTKVWSFAERQFVQGYKFSNSTGNSNGGSVIIRSETWKMYLTARDGYKCEVIKSSPKQSKRKQKKDDAFHNKVLTSKKDY